MGSFMTGETQSGPAFAALAFDVGAETGRGIIGLFDGERVHLEELTRFPNRGHMVEGRRCWDTWLLRAQLRRALSTAGKQGYAVDSVGVDAWGVDFGLVDARGRVLAEPVQYRSIGTSGEATALSIVSGRDLFAATGNQLMHFNTVFQLIERRGELDDARVLFVPDLLNLDLCGAMTTEATIASTSGLLSADRPEWASLVAEPLGIPPGCLPEIGPTGATLGTLRADLVSGVGLGQAPQVVAVASHDTASAVVGTPLRGPASAFISSGTWSLVGVERDLPVVNDEAYASSLGNERGFADTFRLLRNVAGLWLLQRYVSELKRGGDAYTYADLIEKARTARPGLALVDPDSAELARDGDISVLIRAYCTRRGQTEPRTVGEIARCIFESLACKYRRVIEQIERATTVAIEEIHLVGGGARNGLVNQLTADLLERPVMAGHSEATALGNVLVQLYAAGHVASLAEMRDIVRRSFEAQVHLPAGTVDADELYQRFDIAIQHDERERQWPATAHRTTS
jgi:rhamnulokinase